MTARIRRPLAVAIALAMSVVGMVGGAAATGGGAGAASPGAAAGASEVEVVRRL